MRLVGTSVVRALAAAFALWVASAGAEPRRTSISYSYDAFDQSFVRPLTRVFDPALWVRKLSGNRREAANVDENDQVRLPSTWWQPRVGFREVTVAQMLSGPGSGAGPAPGRWQVTGAKTQGVTPGFRIRDPEGTIFQLKFDPYDFPEMATGAEVATTYLYWAAGYNVPDNVIVSFRREDIDIRPGATYVSPTGRRKPITQGTIDRILGKVRPQPDGSYRAVASRFLSGKPLGEWEYRGTRKDDPEDLIPHEHRREIRGLWTLSAWTNNADCSARNTLDMWVTDRGRSFVRHYLIDFGASLGSASVAKHSPRTGNEYVMDYGVVASSLLTLGIKPPRWENIVDPGMPSVGLIESEVFDPGDWRPFLPNPAFDERTERDVRWGARIVAAFGDEHIRAAVARARYSDPRAEEYLVRVLMERRDKIVARWLSEAGDSAAAAGR